ncbi:MAG: tetratricopeptide repeat protein [Elusimicrobia bacterium]|nr:tetratricopeptide repeat protein [Elusimicrobiota bacterium]
MRDGGRKLCCAGWALALALTGFPPLCEAADEFLLNLRKADARVEPEERVEYYSRAIRAWRTGHGTGLLAHCHFNRGETHLLEARLDLAEKDLSKALALDPNNSRAYLLRGRLHLRARRHKLAESDLREYASMKPGDPDGRVMLAESKERGGRLQEALRDFRYAARLDSLNWRALLGQTRVLTSLREYGPAAEVLAKAEAVGGNHEPALAVQAAVLKAETLRLAEALEDFSRAIPLYEERAGDLQRSTVHALDLRECNEALAGAYYGRGSVREKLLDPAGALADYREACRLGHARSCSLAESLAKKPPSEAAPEPPKPVPAAKPAPPKPAPSKKKRFRRPKSDPGERIYGA